MAYSRFGTSDLYVFLANGPDGPDGPPVLECCGCILTAFRDRPAQFGSTEEMVAHVQEHIAAGHDVPDDLIDDLRADDAENFPPAGAA